MSGLFQEPHRSQFCSFHVCTGSIATNLGRHVWGERLNFADFLVGRLFKSPAQGAATSVGAQKSHDSCPQSTFVGVHPRRIPRAIFKFAVWVRLHLLRSQTRVPQFANPSPICPFLRRSSQRATRSPPTMAASISTVCVPYPRGACSLGEGRVPTISQSKVYPVESPRSVCAQDYAWWSVYATCLVRAENCTFQPPHHTGCNVVEPTEQARDMNAAKVFWEACDAATNIKW